MMRRYSRFLGDLILPEAQSSMLGRRGVKVFERKGREGKQGRRRETKQTNLVQISITIEGASPERTLVR